MKNSESIREESGNQHTKEEVSSKELPTTAKANTIQIGPATDKSSKTSLKYELIKILVDKFLIGLILLLAGIFATNLIERLKTERSFSAELNKIRVQKIGEVWEKVYLFEAATQNAMNELHKTPLELEPASIDEKTVKQMLARNDEKIKEVFKESNNLRRELENINNKNRFWLGEDSYIEIKSYADITYNYISAVEIRDKNKIQQLSDKREKLRNTLAQIRDRLSRE